MRSNVLLLILSIFSLANCATKTDATAVLPKDEDKAEINQLKNENTEVSIRDLTAEQFQTGITSATDTIIILDVRTPEEFGNGSIQNAINLNFYDEDFSSQLDSLNHSSTVFVYCMSGGRSGKAKTVLADKGFVRVYNLIGGYGAWPYKN